MSKLSLQFHAMPDEIYDLMREILNDETVFVVEAVGFPIQFRIWNRSYDDAREGERRAFAFTLDPPALNATDLNNFRRSNPDALVLEIGKVSAIGLSESWLSAMGDNKIAMSRWKKAAKLLQASTSAGAVAVNPNSGATAPMKAHRFTRGAQRSFAGGMAMLPAAGNSTVQLPLL